MHRSSYLSPLGEMLTAANEDSIVGVWFVNQKYFPKGVSEWEERADLPVLIKLHDFLDAYFKGDQPEISFPLKPDGSDFRQMVWKILREIPYGKTTTYGAISKQIAPLLGKTQVSAQAVGGAIGHNPISILIPCHRVVGANGSLTGYAGGLDKKQALLKLER